MWPKTAKDIHVIHLGQIPDSDQYIEKQTCTDILSCDVDDHLHCPESCSIVDGDSFSKFDFELGKLRLFIKDVVSE